MSAALDFAADVLAWAALIAGGFFVIVAAIGLHRMPDVFTRMHATSVSDTLGVGFLTLGMLLQTDDWTVAVRLIMILIVLYATGAVATHALSRAALHDGVDPLLADSEGRLRRTDVARIDPELGARLARPLTSEQVEENAAPGRRAAGRKREREARQWSS